MKRLLMLIAGGALAGGLALLTACEGEWTSGGGVDDFNNSRGAGATVNFSGVYKGTMSGGRAVNGTSGAPITQLVISHGGNNIEVVDNNGSLYNGSIGSPGAVASPDASGGYPAGAELVQAQINFSGRDGSSGRNINFVGVIHVVSVTDTRGSSDKITSTTKDVDNDGTKTVITETTTIGSSGDPFYSVTIVTTTIENSTGKEISRTTETTTTYNITEANSQYRLQGTWIEDGGVSTTVDALSPGTAGVITSTATTTTGAGAAAPTTT